VVPEQIVGDVPFFAAAEAPEFGAGHEKDAPVDPPADGLVGAVGLGEERADLGGMGVHVLQPGLGGLLVVGAVDAPVIFQGQIFLEIEEEIVAGHDAAGEEIAGHPVGGVASLEVVGEFAMGEDVDKEETVGAKPARDMGEEALVIFHMLEHFDGDDAVEGLGDIEAVHVAGDDAEVGEAAAGSFGIDVELLSGGVGDAGDEGVRVMFGEPEGEGAPAAAELKDVLAIGDLRAFTGEAEHGFLGSGEGGDAGGPEGAAVFEAGAEAELIEAGGDLVVLFVGGAGLDGDGALLEAGNELHQVSLLRFGAAVVFLAQTFAEQAADAEAEEPVGQAVLLEPAVQKRLGSGSGGGSHRLFTFELGHEGAGGTLIVAIGIALAAEGEFLGERDAGDAEEKKEHEAGTKHGEAAAGRRPRKDKEAYPDEPLKEIIGMARIIPEAGLADAALVFRPGAEALQLPVGEAFAGKGDEPERNAGPFAGRNIGANVQAGDEEDGGQGGEQDGLGLKKPEGFGVRLRAPISAQFGVADVFLRMMVGHAYGEVGAQTQAPKPGEAGDEGAACGIAGGRQGVEHGERQEAEGPGNVDDAEVVEVPSEEPDDGHQGDGKDRGAEQEVEKCGGHGGINNPCGRIRSPSPRS